MPRMSFLLFSSLGDVNGLCEVQASHLKEFKMSRGGRFRSYIAGGCSATRGSEQAQFVIPRPLTHVVAEAGSGTGGTVGHVCECSLGLAIDSLQGL